MYWVSLYAWNLRGRACGRKIAWRPSSGICPSDSWAAESGSEPPVCGSVPDEALCWEDAAFDSWPKTLPPTTLSQDSQSDQQRKSQKLYWPKINRSAVSSSHIAWISGVANASKKWLSGKLGLPHIFICFSFLSTFKDKSGMAGLLCGCYQKCPDQMALRGSVQERGRVEDGSSSAHGN